MARGFYIALLLSISAWAASPARAASFGEAASGVSHGYNGFYQAMKGKRGASQDDARRLARDHLDPVDSRMASTMHRETLRALESLGVRSVTGAQAATELAGTSRTATLPASLVTAAFDGAPALAPEAAAGKGGAAAKPTSSGRPDWVLDGSGIPRELEFDGPKKPAK